MGIINKLYNPYYLAQRYANSPTGTAVGGKEIMSDMAWKAMGGLTLAPLVYLLTTTGDTGRSAGNKANKEIKEYLAAKYVTIPSEMEPDVNEEILRSHKEAQDEGKTKMEQVLSMLDVLAPRTKNLGYAIPLSATALVAALFTGNALLEKRISGIEADRERSKQDDINRNIGKIVESRYRKTRGLDKNSQGWSFKDIVDKFKRTTENTMHRGKNVITGLFTVGLLAGLTAGWAKGRSMNERVILDQGIRKIINDNKVVAESPKIIVPNTYEQYRESSAGRSPSQKRTPVQDLI